MSKLVAELFTRPLISQATQQNQSIVYHSFGHWPNRHFARVGSKFPRGQKVQICPQFLSPVDFDMLWFWNKAMYWNFFIPLSSLMTGLCSRYIGCNASVRSENYLPPPQKRVGKFAKSSITQLHINRLC